MAVGWTLSGTSSAPVRDPVSSPAAHRLLALGFQKGHVHEALRLSQGDEAAAKAVLFQWQRVPPPAFQEASPEWEQEDDLPRIADIAEKAANWVQEAGGGGAALWGKLRDSLTLGGVRQWINDAGAEGSPPLTSRDAWEKWYECGASPGGPCASPRPSEVQALAFHLPDHDVEIQDVDIMEVSPEPCQSAESPGSTAGNSWDVLRRMSTLFPMDVVAGLGMGGDSHPGTPAGQRRKQQRRASSEMQGHDNVQRRKGEIAALLAQGWMSPESVRRLKLELQELQQKAHEAQRSRESSIPGSGSETPSTPSRPRTWSRSHDEALLGKSPELCAGGASSRICTPSTLASSAETFHAKSPRKSSDSMAFGQPPRFPGALWQGQGGGPGREAGAGGAGSGLDTSDEATLSSGPAPPAHVGSGAAAPSARPGATASAAAPPGTAASAGAPAPEAAAPSPPGAGGPREPAGQQPQQGPAGPAEGFRLGATEAAAAPPAPPSGEAAPPPRPPPPPPPPDEPAPAKAAPPPPAGKGTAPPAKGAPAPPPGKGAGPPGKGAGKGSAPPGKGAPPPPGKGKAPPPGKASAGPATKAVGSTALPKGTPLGRKFEWKMLSKDKVAGTVFANLTKEVSVDVTCLRKLFEKPKDTVPVPKAKSAARDQKEVELLSRGRAQNVMIALRKQPLTPGVLQALERLDFDADTLSPEACEVLTGAVPTAEEAKLLSGYRGDPALLREAERQVLPLACMEFPPVGQRLRLMLFRRIMAERSGDVQSGLALVSTALDDARGSAALRAVLHHTVRLGTIINFGPSRPDDSGTDAEAMVGGFNLDALSKLALFRAPGNSRITLLHVLVAQVSAADEDLPRSLLEDLRNVHKAAKTSIAQLALEVADFRREVDHTTACAGARTVGAAAPADEASARLARLAELAEAEASALRDRLAGTREAAKAALDYFAVTAQPKEVDVKAQELCTLLSDFIGAFERAKTQITSDPNLAAACHSKAPSARPSTAPAPESAPGSSA